MDLKSTTQAPTFAIHPYGFMDAADTLAIFIGAVTETAAADYAPEQIRAWARPGERELTSWHEAMQARSSFVATVDGVAAGFSEVDPKGYIDMMFVAPRFLRLGVARRLLAHIEAQVCAEGPVALTANVSITARPFFERQGFKVVAEQHPVMAGVTLTNYAMKKILAGN